MEKLINNEALAFLLPMISSKEFTKKFLINDYFIGAFIGDIDRYEYDNEIVLAYRNNKTMSFLEFDAKLRQNPNYTKISYDYPEKDVVMYVFRVPIELEDDYSIIMNGDYSKISAQYKLELVKFWNNESGKVFKILFKPTSLEEYWKSKGVSYSEVCNSGEYWTPPVIENELFSIDNI